MAITPDTKNWTWVLDETCPECGFDAAGVDRSALGALVRDNVAAWPALLADTRARDRPSDDQWSAHGQAGILPGLLECFGLLPHAGKFAPHGHVRQGLRGQDGKIVEPGR